MSSFPQNSTIASRVDHSPMYTTTDLVVDVILEAVRVTVGDGSIHANCKSAKGLCERGGNNGKHPSESSARRCTSGRSAAR